MTQYAVSRQHAAREHIIAVSNPVAFRALFLPMCLLAVVAFLVTTYIVLMNAMTQKSFEIKKVSTAVTELRQENKRLEVQLAERESIATLADRVGSLGMVQTEKVDYLIAPAGAVALR